MAHPISSLEMTIRTGDDELRGDSTAYVIVLHGGSTRQYSTILKKNKRSHLVEQQFERGHYLESSARSHPQERPTFWHKPAVPRQRLRNA